jgi:hypothetical protein
MTKGDLYLGREVSYFQHFPANGTFGAFYQAQEYIKDLGYEIGSMDRDNPIGFADNEKFGYIAKWHNLTPKDKEQLYGVIISNDFREGAVDVLFFAPSKF